MNFITKTPIQFLEITATVSAPVANNIAMYYGDGALMLMDSEGVLNSIATGTDLAPKLDKEIVYDEVTSEFFHEADGGGYRITDGNDNSVSFLGGNADQDSPIKIELYAIVSTTKLGTRIIQTLNKIYYTKNKNSATYADNDELATIANIPTALSQLANDNNYVIDANYVHTDSNFTAAEKAKLASLNDDHFKGSYATLSALKATYPTSEEGDYAYVGTEGTDEVMCIWDDSDVDWIQSGTPTAETPASVKEKYESNSDTNAYTDSAKATVATVGNVANLTTTVKTSTVAAINEIVTDLANYVPKTRTINGKVLSSNITLANSDIGSEPSIAAGTTSQYWRGDKNWADFPVPTPSSGNIQDFWPANGFGRFSSYVLHPRFSSTGGVCGPDGWMIFSENGSEAHKDYFESSTTFGSGRFGDLVFSRNIETDGDSPYYFNRPFSLEETLPLSSNSVTLSFDIKFGAGFPLGQTLHGLVICVTATTSSSGSIIVDNTGVWSESNVTLATFNEITTGSTSDYERHNFTFNIPSAAKRICICIKHTPITMSADYSFYMGPMTIAIGNDYAQPMAKPYGEDYIANCRRFFSAGSTYFGQTYNGTKVTIYNMFPIAMEEVPICIRAVDNDAPVGIQAAQISDVVKCGKEGFVIRRTGNSAIANGGWSSTYYFVCLQWVFNNAFSSYS